MIGNLIRKYNIFSFITKIRLVFMLILYNYIIYIEYTDIY